jgi:peptidoglycan/LPS O-acetylase OafA/YrhL
MTAAEPQRRLATVDALRAIAALSVVAYHLAFVLGGFSDEHLGPYYQQLNIGVPLFFLISGFLLYRPYALARLQDRPAPSTARYALRRALRILPAYWVALTVLALLHGRDDVFSGTCPLTYYGLLQAYDADTVTGGIGQAWTLSVEVAFYVLLPFLGIGIARLLRGGRGDGLRGELLALGGLLVLSLAWKAVVLGAVAGDDPARVPLTLALPAQLDHFALGMMLAALSAGAAVGLPAGLRAEAVAGAHPWIPLAVALVAFVLVGHGVDTGRVVPDALVEHSLRGLVALGLMTPAVLGVLAGGVPRRALAAPALAWIGLVSYGIYLYHLDLIEWLDEAGLPAGGVVVLGVAASIAAGALSWHLVERPAIRLGRRIAPPRHAPAAPPGPVTEPRAELP